MKVWVRKGHLSERSIILLSLFQILRNTTVFYIVLYLSIERIVVYTKND